MVREHGSLTKDAETNQAAWEAVKGGAYGGIKWGAFFAVAGVQDVCSLYIQMSAMIFGGMIEADARMVRYHQAVRSHKKMQSDMAVWRAYENEFEERGMPAVASEGKAQRKSDGQ
ncbi:hypothetical protein E8E11_004001 [Didymella keratinophila]|nr:hypothetical protein E8E11_004001 [Didymella keratinophila]